MLAQMYLCLRFEVQQVKTKYCSGIAQPREYLPHVVMFDQTLDSDSGLRLNSLEDSDDVACACVRVEFRFHLGHPYCPRR